MAEVAVVGAGVGGMAVAARLAKLGHTVTVFEREPTAGGALHRVERDGFSWDAGPSSTGLPAVLRDLFRTSGRPIERCLELRMRAPARRHIFSDGASVDLPTGSRADQIRAVDAGLGAGAGRRWADFVDARAAVWDLYRRGPSGPDGPSGPPPRERTGQLPVRPSLRRLLSRSLPDERLRQMVAHRYVMGGSDLTNVPAYAAIDVYVERSFGVWTSPTGLTALSDALVARLAERRVDVRYGAAVARITSQGGRATGVELSDGARVAADVVVGAIDPLAVFTELLAGPGSGGRRVFESATRVDPPSVTHLGLRHADDEAVAGEVVLHGDPLIVVTTTGAAPAGHRAWTVRRRGDATADLLTVLASRGFDVREDVVTRIDRSPRQILAEPGGPSYAVAWDGWRAQARRSSFAVPLPNLHVLAATLAPDASIPQVAWTAATIAGRVGKA